MYRDIVRFTNFFWGPKTSVSLCQLIDFPCEIFISICTSASRAFERFLVFGMEVLLFWMWNCPIPLWFSLFCIIFPWFSNFWAFLSKSRAWFVALQTERLGKRRENWLLKKKIKEAVLWLEIYLMKHLVGPSMDERARKSEKERNRKRNKRKWQKTRTDMKWKLAETNARFMRKEHK